MYSQYYAFKLKAIELRRAGKTYGDIKRLLGKPIPKSTLSNWFRNIHLTEFQQGQINKRVHTNIQKAQTKAWLVNKAKRERYIQEVRNRVSHLPNELRKKDTAKIALAMLYLGEGGKTRKGSLMFGNADRFVIQLFLSLLRHCYDIDETKFRCTVQCRADQNTKQLKRFWSRTTKIPRAQFYKARIDPRTNGRPSRNPDYKGVCRIDYFSADIFHELDQIVQAIYMGL
ncbi:MAG TPA: hypothetical protein VGA53_05005 [Candidatus Paceibacterota bacterium]